MLKPIIRAGTALAVLCLAAGLMAGPAVAHERRAVGGHLLVVGWADEPAYTGFKNAIQIRLSNAATNEPVTDLAEGELKVSVQFGDEESESMPVEPRFRVGAFGDPGDYQADLIPSRPGTYSYHLIGTIKGEKVDEKFTCGEETFDCPRAPSEVEFPAKDPSSADLASRVQRMDSRVSSAADSSGLARMLAIAALIVALVGLALALFGAKKRSA
ncbi:MAG: hypothetical protein ACRDIU_07670 [Actinomycetota bacterium]